MKSYKKIYDKFSDFGPVNYYNYRVKLFSDCDMLNQPLRNVDVDNICNRNHDTTREDKRIVL